MKKLSAPAGAGNRRETPAWDALDQKIVACERCPRLRAYCSQVAAEKHAAFRDEQYWGRPVPNFGDPAGRLLIVGLAPAAHGANRTGRVFTGDRSGEWLYRALHKEGFANQSQSVARDDGLRLIDCAITAAVHCAPPANKPSPSELVNCQPWLERTFDLLPVRVLVALGQIAPGASPWLKRVVVPGIRERCPGSLTVVWCRWPARGGCWPVIIPASKTPSRAY